MFREEWLVREFKVDTTHVDAHFPIMFSSLGGHLNGSEPEKGQNLKMSKQIFLSLFYEINVCC